MQFPGTDLIKPQTGDEAVQFNFKTRPEVRHIIHCLAEAEDVDVCDLACEGIARVLMARIETGELRDIIDADYQKELEAIAAQKALLWSIEALTT